MVNHFITKCLNSKNIIDSTGEAAEHPPMPHQGEGTSLVAARQQLEALTLAGPRPKQPPQSWEMQETDMMGNLALQQSRNGSDASFKVNVKKIAITSHNHK